MNSDPGQAVGGAFPGNLAAGAVIGRTVGELTGRDQLDLGDAPW